MLSDEPGVGFDFDKIQVEYEDDNFDTLLVPETKPIQWPNGQYVAPVDDYLASSDFFDRFPDYDIEPVWNSMHANKEEVHANGFTL